MKKIHSLISPLLKGAMLSLTAASFANAAVFVNPAWLREVYPNPQPLFDPTYRPPNDPGKNYPSFTLGFDSGGLTGISDYFFLALSPVGSIIFYSYTLGSLLGLFEIGEGELIGPEMLIGGAEPVFPLHHGSFDVEYAPTINEPFYFGIAADYDTPDSTTYGWVKLQVDLIVGIGFELRLLESAVEDTHQGIRAGSFVSVPEPSGAALVAGAIGLFLSRARRRQI